MHRLFSKQCLGDAYGEVNLLTTRRGREKELLMYSPGLAVGFLCAQRNRRVVWATVAEVSPRYGVLAVHERDISRALHTVESFRL